MSEANHQNVKQEDLVAALKQYSPARQLARERDLLLSRYRIQTNQPLPELSSAFAKAYAAIDEQAPTAGIYALVFDSNVPARQKNIDALKEFRHPNLVALLADGVTEIGILSEARYVAVLEKPVGQTLSQLLSQGKNPVSETTLINFVLRPLTEILLALSNMGISHNRINLNNVYLGNNIISLGECISEPSGFSQPELFEPIERALCSPWGKSDYATSADCYALAIIALHLALGFQPFSKVPKDILINEILAKGAYHALAIQWDFSDVLQDFFRGLLNDSRRDRWDPKNIENWLAGKRFNLILPSLPHEASRGFEFMEEAYFNRKIIAYNMFRHWPEGRALLFDNKLVRWLETNAHKVDIGQSVTRIASSNTGDTVRSERQNNELLARVIMTLDPTGPIRLKHVSVITDGVGAYLLYAALISDEQEDMQTITQIIENDLLASWIEQQKASGTDYNSLMSKMQKVRLYMRMNSLGFGIERCLYDLYPNLSCQSPLVKRFHVLDLPELLFALDTIAAQKGLNEHFMDRHMAGFIASKLGIAKEIRLLELGGIPDLSSNPKLIALKLLLRAQQKAGDPVLKGLSYWISIQLFLLLDTIHKRSQRYKLQTALRDAANRGSLQAVATVLLNPDAFVSDYKEFQETATAFAARRIHIEEVKNHTFLARHARIAGRGIAQTVAYGVCLTTIYFTLKAYLHF